jgi:hypothetical protein
VENFFLAVLVQIVKLRPGMRRRARAQRKNLVPSLVFCEDEALLGLHETRSSELIHSKKPLANGSASRRSGECS